MQTKTLLLIAALALSPALRAAEPKVPEVKTSDAPEVTDPDLKEATPPMRQGTEEPIGGFKSAGMKGKSALSLGWDGMAVFGYSYWAAECMAIKAAVGGSYSDSQDGPTSSHDGRAKAQLGLRFKGMDLGDFGFLFADGLASAEQRDAFTGVQTDNGTYTSYNDQRFLTQSYGAGLNLGAELFWPGQRRVSLEAKGGLSAVWSFQEKFSRQDSNPSGFVTTTETYGTARYFEFNSLFDHVDACLNIYF